MARLGVFFAVCAALFGVALSSAVAHEVTLRAEERYHPYTGKLPHCDDDLVLKHITQMVHSREKIDWDTDLRVEGYDRIGTTANRPWGKDFVPRRFCHARVHLNNGHRYSLVYSLIEDGGVSSLDWGVQFCIVGLDKGWHFAPSCRAARP